MIDPDNLPDNLNLGFGDSASQKQNNLLSGTGAEMPSISELKNRPFASNLENAKILSHITRVRIEKFGISPMKAELFTKSFS